MEAFLDKDKKVGVIKYGDTATEIPIDIYDGGNTVIVKDFEDYTVTLEVDGTYAVGNYALDIARMYEFFHDGNSISYERTDYTPILFTPNEVSDIEKYLTFEIGEDKILAVWLNDNASDKIKASVKELNLALEEVYLIAYTVGVESELPVACHPNQLVLTLPEDFYSRISRPTIGSFKSTLVKIKFTIDGQTMDDLRLNIVDSLINYDEVTDEDKLDNQPAQGPAIDTPKGSRKTAYDSVDSLFDETGYDN